MKHLNVVCLYLFLLLLMLACSAAAFPATLAGEVVNEENQPVTGAKVWLFRYTPEQSEIKDMALVDTAQTAADGSYALEDPEYDSLDDVSMFWQVCVHAEGLSVDGAWVGEPTEPINFKLAKPAAMSGRVLAEGDEPVARAKVSIVYASTGEVSTPHFHSFIQTNELEDLVSTLTDESGHFELNLLPEGAGVVLEIAADGYGRVQSGADVSELRLKPAGSIVGQLVCEDNPQIIQGVTIRASARVEAKERIPWPLHLKATTEEDGTFRFPELAPMLYQLRVAKTAVGSEWQAPEKNVGVKSSETTEVEFKLERAYLLTGRVVDAQTGEPIEGVDIYVSSTPGSPRGRVAPTDEDGYYSLRALPGKTVVYPGSRPEPYSHGGYQNENRQVLVTSADLAIPDISLKKGVTVEGVVLDDEGQPVAGATIFHTGTEFGFLSPIYADEEGKFSIPRMDPDRPFTIRARDGDRMTEEPLSVDPKQTEPFEVVIREGAGARLCVRALDDAGMPIAGAEVVAMWRAENWSTTGAKGQTDATGCFESELVWPEGSYEITVTAEGCPKVKTDSWPAVSEQTHDFGDVVLVAACGFVEGRVVDAEGQPAVGAKVYNKGDGPQALAVNADEQGHFRLEGLYKGHAYVFAEKGDLFGGARMPVGAEDGVITVTPEPVEVKLAEPAQAISLTSPETDKRVAEELILEALDKPGTMSAGSYVSTLIATLAVCDPDKAFQLSAQRGGKDDDRIMRSLGSWLLQENPEEALALLQNIEGAYSRLYALLEAAQKLGASDPARAIEVLETIIPASHTVGALKHHVAFLAKCGEALYEFDPQSAEPVIRKAESMAKALPTAEGSTSGRGCAAEALCHVDLDGALALIKDLTGEEHQTTRHQPNIAARIAATQPERVPELMRVLSDGSYGRHMPRVVYNMAPTHPDKALELAETVKEPAAKARSLGFIALALAEISPDRAAEVFGEALATVRGIKVDPSYGGYQAREPVNTMAELAQIALQIGYPGVERIAWRAVSLRPAPSQSPWDSGDQRAGEYIKNLAFAHPALARDLIQDTIARQAVEEQRGRSDLTDNLTIAATLVDASLAAKLVRALPADDPEDEHPWTLRQYCHAASYLLRSPEERYTGAMGSYGQWVPGADAD